MNSLSQGHRRPIRILSDQVVNQIAAGEVVERPASVVKELVENAIDAGARQVTVSITNGGCSGIEVVDDGVGMSKTDALLAIERFGTSKIQKADDLLSIATHGFRGEALPSIASVSRFKLSSSPRDQEPSSVGVSLELEAGTLKNVHEVALAAGTKIEVKQLFYNVPARRKFLRSENTEAGLVKTQLIDFALAYPKIRFRLIVDGKEVVNHQPVSSFSKRALELKLAGERPLEIEESLVTAAGEMRISATLSQPVECVLTSNRLRLLVNRRSVRDKLLLKAIRSGYGNFLKPGRYPSGVMILDLPPTEVDVNVHPQKTEVRFRRPDLVFGAITKAIQKVLASFSHLPSIEQETPLADYIVSEPANSFSFPELLQNTSQIGFGFSPPVSGTLPKQVSRFRYVGQVMKCFLLMEGPDQLAIVDMHAAHERVVFYRLKCQLSAGGVNSQQLLIPEKISISAGIEDRFSEIKATLDKLGFDLDLIGENTALVRAIPAVLADFSPQNLLTDIFSLPEWEVNTQPLENLLDAALSRLACHRSIRSGRELESVEVYELLDALEEAESSGFCPHGRPVIKILPRSELEKMFGRVQF